jgi:hypothetical protein
MTSEMSAVMTDDLIVPFASEILQVAKHERKGTFPSIPMKAMFFWAVKE